jgi:uncharacterized protein YndB with AHSA1/START domain
MDHLSTAGLRVWPSPDEDFAEEADVFKALADPSRRLLLDSLFDADGQTLGELSAQLPGMTRFGVMKHPNWVSNAPIRYWIGDDLVVDGTVVEADPPRKLVTTWSFRRGPKLRDDPPSRVTWKIDAAEDACKLTLVHDDFPRETETYRSVGSGWPVVLSSLKSLLETGEALKVSD